MKFSRSEIVKQFILDQSIDKNNLDYNIAEHYAFVLQQLESMSRQCMWIFDYYQNNFYYLSRNTNFFKNKDHSLVSENGYDYFIRNTHPDDVLYVLSIQKSVWNFLKNLKIDDLITDYRVAFTMRMQNSAGQYVLVSLQVKIIASDGYNNIWLGLGIIEEINKQLAYLPYIENTVSGKRIVLDNPAKQKHEFVAPSLSERELRLLNYLADDFTQLEIANLMNISLHTLKNHRKRLYRKLHAINKREVLKNAYYLRLINID